MGGRNRELTRTATQLNSGAIHVLRALRLADRMAGVPPAQLSALSVLVFGGPTTLGGLARAEEVAGPTMTRIVDGLVASRLALRRPHRRDGRAVEVAATDKGVDVMHRAKDARVAALVSALRTLDEADRNSLAAAAPLLDELAGEVRAVLVRDARNRA